MQEEPVTQNGVELADPPRIIDITPLLRDLEQQLAAAEQEQRAALLKTTRVRGLLDGVRMALEFGRTPPVVTTGEG